MLDRFEDKEAYTQRNIDAKSLKLTTPFVRGGLIDRKKIAGADPSTMFHELGFEQGIKNFKFTG